MSAAPLDHLDALRQPGEGYSEVILRMAQIESSRPRRTSRAEIKRLKTQAV